MATQTLKDGNQKYPQPNEVGKSYRPDKSFRHIVSDGENWQKLADRYKVSAKELILSNYKTDKAEYVNWYLRNYMACDTPTADRYNWRFSTSARNNKSIDSPRRGVLFVVPDWVLVIREAKRATIRFVEDWFRACTLKGTIEGARLTVRPGDVVSRWMSKTQFQFELARSGFPDALAAATVAILFEVLTTWMHGLNDVQPDAFPLYAMASNPVPQMPAKPWKLLHSSTAHGFPSAEFLRRRILMLVTPDDASALAVPLSVYCRWFVKAFDALRKTAVTDRVIGWGTALHGPLSPLDKPGSKKGPVLGNATGLNGFLANVRFPENA